MKTSQALRRVAFFYPGPVRLDPLLNRRLVAFDGPTRRLLRTPAHAVQQSPDVIDVILDTETLGNDLGDPRAGPKIGRKKAGGSGAFEQDTFQARPGLVVERRPGAGRALSAVSPPFRYAASQRRTLRRSTPSWRATSTGCQPCSSNSMVRCRRRSNVLGLPGGLMRMNLPPGY